MRRQSLKIAIFLLTYFSKDRREAPPLSDIKDPNLSPSGEPTPRLRPQVSVHDPLHKPDPSPLASARARACPPTPGLESRSGCIGMLLQPPGHFNLHLQEMALTPEEFRSLRVT